VTDGQEPTHRTFAKVCGLRTEEQIDWAIELGYDAIGVVLAPKSPRYCPPERARELAAHARGRIPSFVVALSWAQAEQVADAFDVVQIYEPVPLPNLAFASKDPPPPGVAFDWFVYDASTGSGVFEDFPAWLAGVPGRLLVAGGLDAANVGQVIAALAPFGVDVSSGVESSPGVKDRDLMAAYIAEVRRFRPS
jgi:phosphoribosylanthranilate isomerase